jgi:hypothetical protein
VLRCEGLLSEINDSGHILTCGFLVCFPSLTDKGG